MRSQKRALITLIRKHCVAPPPNVLMSHGERLVVEELPPRLYHDHAMSNPIDSDRRARLDKLFNSVCRGKTAIAPDNVTQLLEALYTNPNPIACLGASVHSKQA